MAFHTRQPGINIVTPDRTQYKPSKQPRHQTARKPDTIADQHHNQQLMETVTTIRSLNLDSYLCKYEDTRDASSRECSE
jgi:hypothetical protein